MIGPNVKYDYQCGSRERMGVLAADYADCADNNLIHSPEGKKEHEKSAADYADNADNNPES